MRKRNYKRMVWTDKDKSYLAKNYIPGGTVKAIINHANLTDKLNRTISAINSQYYLMKKNKELDYYRELSIK